MSRKADEEEKRSKPIVRFEDNLDDDENMAKRKAQSDGESEADGG